MSPVPSDSPVTDIHVKVHLDAKGMLVVDHRGQRVVTDVPTAAIATIKWYAQLEPLPDDGEVRLQDVDMFAATDVIGRLLPESVWVDKTRAEDERRAVRLWIDADDGAATIPWEFSRIGPRNSQQRPLPLELSVVRGDPTATTAPLSGEVDPLVVAALDAPQGGQGSWEALCSSIRQRLAAQDGLTLVEPRSVDILKRLLEEQEEDRPVLLIVVAHGRHDDEAGYTVSIGGQDLAGAELTAWCASANVQLAVVAACHSSLPANGSVSFASQLAASGVPAVVAMHGRSEAEHLEAFVAALLDGILVGESVEESVRLGRHAMNTRSRLHQWGVPTLTLTTRDSRFLEHRRRGAPGQPPLPVPATDRYSERAWVQDRIRDWLEAADAPAAFLLIGGAGTGKTSILSAAAVPGRPWSPGRVVAAVLRPAKGRNDAFSWENVAQAIRRALMDEGVLLAPPPYVADETMRARHEADLFGQAAGALPPGPCLVVVADALDEAQRRGEVAFLAFVERLATATTGTRLRLLCSTQPESPVRVSGLHMRRTHISDDAPTGSNRADLERFVDRQLVDFPDDDRRRAVPSIAERAGDVWMWARMVCQDLVDSHAETGHLPDPLRLPQGGLDEYWADAVAKLRERYPDRWDTQHRSLLEALAAGVGDAVPGWLLAHVVGLDNPELTRAIDEMHSLLIWNRTGWIGPIHASLANWLRNRPLSRLAPGRWHVPYFLAVTERADRVGWGNLDDYGGNVLVHLVSALSQDPTAEDFDELLGRGLATAASPDFIHRYGQRWLITDMSRLFKFAQAGTHCGTLRLDGRDFVTAVVPRLEMLVGVIVAARWSSEDPRHLNEFDVLVNEDDRPGGLRYLEQHAPDYKQVVRAGQELLLSSLFDAGIDLATVAAFASPADVVPLDDLRRLAEVSTRCHHPEHLVPIVVIAYVSWFGALAAEQPEDVNLAEVAEVASEAFPWFHRFNDSGLEYVVVGQALARVALHEQAAEAYRLALGVTPSDHPRAITRLAALASVLRQQNADTTPSEVATALARVAQEMQPPRNDAQATAWIALATAAMYDAGHVDAEVLGHLVAALASLPEGAGRGSGRFFALMNEFLRGSLPAAAEPTLLDRHIDLMVSITTRTDIAPADLAIAWAILASRLQLRQRRDGGTADLQAAADAYEHALALIPDDDDRHADLLADLANALDRLYDHDDQSNPDIPDRIVEICQKVLARTPDPPPDNDLSRTISMWAGLGNHLRIRHAANGDPADLQAAADAYERAVPLLPDDDDRRTDLLADLANALDDLYYLDDDTNPGLPDRIVEICQKVLARTPNPPPDDDLSRTFSMWVILGKHLRHRQQANGGTSDLEAAVDAHEQALTLLPEDHHRRTDLLADLAIILVDLENTSVASSIQNVADHPHLERIIEVCEEILQRTPDPSSPADQGRLVLAHEYLSQCRRFRQERHGGTADLESAADACGRTLALLPHDHEGRVNLLVRQANTLVDLWFLLGRPTSPGLLGQAAQIAREIPEAERREQLQNLRPALVAILERGEG